MLSPVVLASVTAAQPDLLWMEQFGTVAQDQATGLARDNGGGVFVTGFTYGSLGGPNAGSDDAFLAHHDSAGDQIFLMQFGTSGSDEAYASASDGAGGVFVAGSTTGSLGGPNAGSWDAFLVRLDSAGIPGWIKQFGTFTDDRGYALAPDGAGGVFIAGWTSGDLGGSFAGGTDVYLTRFDSAGNQAWIRQFGTGYHERACALGSDQSGGVFVAGWTHGDLGGPIAGGTDAYLTRFDGDGSQAWIKQFGTSDDDQITALLPDEAGGVFVAGFTKGNLGGPNQGGSDMFVARYDGAGEQIWVTQLGTDGSDEANALAPDGNGGMFVAGYTGGSLGGPNAGNDAFVARYDQDGSVHGITQFGTNSSDLAYALAPAAGAGVFVAGYTDGSLGGPSAGGLDVFLGRFRACYSDCDGSGTLDLFDFLCFVNEFNGGTDYADCSANGAFDLFDFLCFVNAFNEGC